MTPEPIDTTAIAERLSVSLSAVRQWRVRDIGFPEPWRTLAIGPVWNWDEVERWAKQTDRL